MYIFRSELDWQFQGRKQAASCRYHEKLALIHSYFLRGAMRLAQHELTWALAIRH
jgi:hypothetical protein